MNMIKIADSKNKMLMNLRYNSISIKKIGNDFKLK